MKRIFQRNRVQLLKYIMEEPNEQRPEPSAEDQLPAPTSAWHFAPEATAQPNITAPPRGSAIVRGIRAALRRLRRFFKPKERRAAPRANDQQQHATPIGSSRIESSSPTQDSCSLSVNIGESSPASPSSSASEYEPTSSPTITKVTDLTRLSLDSFQVHSIIGQGGFGKVVLVSHPASEQRLAMKMVEKRCLLRNNPNTATVELQALQMTRSSPFTTNLHGAFQTENHLFYVMEYLSRGDLRSLIRTFAPFKESTVRFYAAEILCGLQYLHSLGIVHRDIKPANILLDNAGHIKISDFGLAVTGVFGANKTTGLAGTPRFIAPEVCLNIPYNTSVDYYSFGVLVYLMATGKYPFCDENGDRNAISSRNTVLCPPSMSDDLRDFILKLLQEHPLEREKAVSNIREHPFFRQTNWEKVEARETKPPYQLRTPIEHQTIEAEDLITPKERWPWSLGSLQQAFNKFSFMSKELRLGA